MSMNALIKDILKGVGSPVAFQEYTGVAVPVWITFFFINEQGAEFADDTEVATGYSVQIDVWSKGNYLPAVEAVKEAMKAAGWTRSFAYDLYEKDTKIFHKALRFRYTENV